MTCRESDAVELGRRNSYRSRETMDPVEETSEEENDSDAWGVPL